MLNLYHRRDNTKYPTEEARRAAKDESHSRYSRTPKGRLCISRANRRAALKRVGVTEDDYERLYAKQKGKCAICRTKVPHERPSVRHFSVDHCHVTGAVRGLLCNRCNMVLGKVKDSPAILLAAAAYLTAARPPRRKRA